MLSLQLPNGMVPNFGTPEVDRTRPTDPACPWGAMCVWKLHQRHPDTSILGRGLSESWCGGTTGGLPPTPGLACPYRDGNCDGLLEWGSESGIIQQMKVETWMTALCGMRSWAIRCREQWTWTR